MKLYFFAIDAILNRKVAFKIWLNLKPNDLRDKQSEGLYNVRLK